MAAEALNAYDFVLVLERFDESLLALQQVLSDKGLNVTQVDLLYVKARESGASYGDTTLPAHPDFRDEPMEVRSALLSQMALSADLRLHSEANRRLDAFNISLKALQTFQYKLRMVERICRPFAFQDCLWNDHGCGQTCLDEVARVMAWH